MTVTNLTADAEQFTSNVFLVEGAVPSLVDAGSIPGTAERIAAHGIDLERVVITHQHHDHVTQLDAICEAFDPAVYAYGDHPLRTHVLDDGDVITIGDVPYRAIHTPGHADDHVVFRGENAIFSGDVVMYEDEAFSGGSFGRTDRPGRSRGELITSLERLLAELSPSIRTMYPGHGDTYSGDVIDVVETTLRRARRREPKYPDE